MHIIRKPEVKDTEQRHSKYLCSIRSPKQLFSGKNKLNKSIVEAAHQKNMKIPLTYMVIQKSEFTANPKINWIYWYSCRVHNKSLNWSMKVAENFKVMYQSVMVFKQMLMELSWLLFCFLQHNSFNFCHSPWSYMYSFAKDNSGERKGNETQKQDGELDDIGGIIEWITFRVERYFVCEHCKVSM